MPLIKLHEINQQAAWAIWKVEEDLADLKKAILPEHDKLDELSKIHHPQKQQEWLAARLATQTLLQHFREPFNGILKDRHGKPYCSESHFHLSLAHSFPYAVAIVNHQKPVGIDIEKPRLQLQRIASKFLNYSEEIAADQDLTKLCWYWAAKETLYKIYGRKKLIFKKDLAIEPFNPDIDKKLKGLVNTGKITTEYILQFHSHQDFFICYNI